MQESFEQFARIGGGGGVDDAAASGAEAASSCANAIRGEGMPRASLDCSTLQLPFSPPPVMFISDVDSGWRPSPPSPSCFEATPTEAPPPYEGVVLL